MEDLLDVALGIAGRAGSEEEVEAYLVHERNFEVKAYGGDVESVSSAEPRGAGVRVVTGHKTGFSYTTDLSTKGLEEALSLARANALCAGEDDAVGLPPASDEAVDVPGLIDDNQPSVTSERKVEFALELERATKDQDARIKAVEQAAYADSDAEVAIASSTGVAGSYRRTDAWCYSVAICEDDGDREMGFDFGLARGLAGLDLAEVARGSAERGLATLGATKIPSERLAVVFDPYVAGQFLGVLSQALTGEAVQKGRSLFAGRVGDGVAASELTLIDDGGLAGAPGSSPWDAEGVPTRRTEVISDGVLRSFLYDTTSARREARASTGNASRSGFKSVPKASPSNLAFEPTGSSAEEIWRRAGRALLVQEFHGVHSGANPVSGDFSVGATGRLLENGEPSRPVKEVTIAAPMLEVLRNVVAVSDDRRWLPFGGSFGGATTLISEMTVAGGDG
jgi:PmbA protein